MKVTQYELNKTPPIFLGFFRGTHQFMKNRDISWPTFQARWQDSPALDVSMLRLYPQSHLRRWMRWAEKNSQMEMGNVWHPWHPWHPWPCSWDFKGKSIINLINLPDFGKNCRFRLQIWILKSVLTGVLCLRRLTSVIFAQGKKKRPSPKKSARGTEVQYCGGIATGRWWPFLDQIRQAGEAKEKKVPKKKSEAKPKVRSRNQKTEQILLQLVWFGRAAWMIPANQAPTEEPKEDAKDEWVADFPQPKQDCPNLLCQAEINGSDRTGLAGPTESHDGTWFAAYAVCCEVMLKEHKKAIAWQQNYSDSQESDKITFVAHCSDWRKAKHQPGWGYQVLQVQVQICALLSSLRVL